jgi:hypothetical protein
MNLRRWITKVERELSGPITNGMKLTQRYALVDKIETMLGEVRSGVFHTADGTEVAIDNPELAALVFLSFAENWLGWLFEGEGKTEQANEHFARHKKAQRTIYGGKFSEKEQAAAWKILD